MHYRPEEFRHVRYLWDDDAVQGMDPVDRLVYRSNLLGADLRITNTGGGNTSSKVTMPDPLTGAPMEVLWVKGSGGDLRTSNRTHFASLSMERLRQLRELYRADAGRGPKTPVEDRMVSLYPHAVYNLNPRASSIDTPLHAFIPYRHVDHTHPHAIIALAAAENGQALTQAIFGDAVGWIPWQRPGFDLGLRLEAFCREHPQAIGAVLGGHGLINWADDDKECYERTLAIIETAARYIQAQAQGQDPFGGPRYPALDPEARRRILVALLPWLRGRVSQEHRFVATVDTDEAVLTFVNSQDAPRLAELGTSCPDHFLRTKIKPLYVDWNPVQEDLATLQSRLQEGLERYRQDYRAYYQRYRRPDSPPMRDPNPTVILVPGVGLIAWGKNKSESRVTAEFYKAAVEVMRGAEALDRYTALPLQEAFDIEYWALEEAKLRRMPPEKGLARQIAVVIGGGSGIGRAVAQRMIQEDAHVVVADLDAEAAQETAEGLVAQAGMGIGLAGTGISRCGPAISLEVDITDRTSVRRLLETTVLAYGGVDHIVVTAGLFVPPDATGHIPDPSWADTFAVNVTGPYLVADEARPIWAAQELPGSLVIATSVNGVVPKRGSEAYDASKAAANHLIRELALALAPLVRVNGLAPAAVVQGSAMFPRERIIASLLKYGLDFDESEDTETLRERLAAFYARRTLLGVPVLPEDQAEVVYLLCTRAFGKTTGQIFTVDGGLPEAFLR